jgi:hypothetical protein
MVQGEGPRDLSETETGVNEEEQGAEIIDFGIAQREREGKGLYVYGHIRDGEQPKPPMENVCLVGITPEGVTIWRYLGYLGLSDNENV